MIKSCDNLIGVDLSATSVKAVCINQDKVMDSHGIVDLAPGANDTDVILALKGIVGTDCANCPVVVGLRGLDVLTKLIKVDIKEIVNIEQVVEGYFAEILPVDRNEVEVSWEVIAKEEGKVKVLIIAVPNKVLSRYNRLIEGAGLKVKTFEINALAVRRALGSQIKGKAMVVDVHADETDIEFYDDQTLIYDKTVSIGGMSITRAIAKKYSMTFAEAEMKKRSSNQVEAGEFDQLYRSTADQILTEAIRSASLVEIEYNCKPQEILLSGGDFATEQLLKYFTENLTPIAMSRLVMPEAVMKSDNINKETGERYRLLNAVGLALKTE